MQGLEGRLVDHPRRKRGIHPVKILTKVFLEGMRASPRSSAPSCTADLTSPRCEPLPSKFDVIADVARRVFVRLDDARGGAAVGTPPPRVGFGRETIGSDVHSWRRRRSGAKVRVSRRVDASSSGEVGRGIGLPWTDRGPDDRRCACAAPSCTRRRFCPELRTRDLPLEVLSASRRSSRVSRPEVRRGGGGRDHDNALHHAHPRSLFTRRLTRR